jgi:proliferating cell nuclear antigen
MFLFTFQTSSTLSAVIDATKDLAESVNFVVDETGLGFVAMDSAHVSLIRARFPRFSFSHFDPGNGAAFGVHLNSMSKALKFARSDMPLTMKLDESGDALLIESGTASVTFKLLDIDNEDFAMPEFERDAAIEMQSADFRATMRDLSFIGDTVKMTVHDGEAAFATIGDIGSVHLTIRNGDDGAKVTGVFDDGEFSLKYMVSFSKAASISKTTRIVLSREMPAEIEFENLSFFLAPKIADDEQIDEDM